MSVLKDPEDILVEFLRSKVTDPRVRYTSESDSFNAVGGQTEFDLSPSVSSNLVRCINSVSLNGSDLLKWQDYEVDLVGKKIVLTTGATSGDAVVVNYSSSLSGEEWIYPGFPIATLGETKFPRVSVVMVNMTGDRQGGNVASYLNRIHFQVDVWVKDRFEYVFGGHNYNKQELANYLGYKIELAFKSNINDLYSKLFDEDGLAFGPFSYDDETQTFRHKQEVVLSAINAGE